MADNLTKILFGITTAVFAIGVVGFAVPILINSHTDAGALAAVAAVIGLVVTLYAAAQTLGFLDEKAAE